MYETNRITEDSVDKMEQAIINKLNLLQPKKFSVSCFIDYEIDSENKYTAIITYEK
jgi:hypothetical protein